MALFSELDLWLFQAVNGFAARSAVFDKLVGGLDMTSLKSLAIFTVFGVLWNVPSKDLRRQREVLLVLFAAVAVALVVNRSLSFLLPFRARPMVTPGIGYVPPAGEHHVDLEHWSSFPSDNATLLFAVATCFWFVSRAWGLWFAAFSGLALLARVCLGVHYPGDVIVGALIGIAVALVFNRESLREALARPLLLLEKRAPTYFYALLFAGLFELATLFWLTRKIGKGLFHLLAG